VILLFVSSNQLYAGFAHEVAECSKLVGLSVATAVIYGVVNDQVTARFSPEYFSQGFHLRMRNCWEGPVFGRLKSILEKTESPTVVGLIWGTVATWWMGAFLSIPIVAASRIGSLPKSNAQQLVIPTAFALLGISIATVRSGIRGYQWAKNASPEDKSDKYFIAAMGTPLERMDHWIAVAWAHQSAYANGALAGIGISVYALARCFMQTA
jgi:hypothetical protein